MATFEIFNEPCFKQSFFKKNRVQFLQEMQAHIDETLKRAKVTIKQKEGRKMAVAIMDTVYWFVRDPAIYNAIISQNHAELTSWMEPTQKK